MKTSMKSRLSKKSIKEPLENINPLTDFLYRKLVFDAWLKFSSTILSRLKKAVENDENDYFESGSDDSKKGNSSSSYSSDSLDKDESSNSSQNWKFANENGNPHVNSLRSSASDTTSEEEQEEDAKAPAKTLLRVNTHHESTKNLSNLLVRPEQTMHRRSLMLPNTVFNFD